MAGNLCLSVAKRRTFLCLRMTLSVVVVMAMVKVSAVEVVLSAVIKASDPVGAVAGRSRLSAYQEDGWHLDVSSHFDCLQSSDDCCWRRSCAMSVMSWLR